MERDKSQSHSSSRISGLDSLRGIAALIVVICHYRLVVLKDFFDSTFYNMSPLHWTSDGRVSVILFFILSGFVLVLPFLSDMKMKGGVFSYKKFLIRRFCRIYLPFAVAILLSALMWGIFASGQKVEMGWDGWNTPLTFGDMVLHLLATGMKGSDYLIPPAWTLVQEMRVAIIFPLLVYLVRKGGIGAVVAAVIVGFLAGKGYAMLEPGKDMYFASTLTGTFLLMLYYIQFFIMGIYLAFYRGQWSVWIDKVPSRLFIIAGLLILVVPLSILSLPYTIQEAYLAGVGIFLIISCVTFERFQNVLSFAPFQWLGKVSYSLYLTHTIIMMAMIYALHPYMSMEMILAMALPIILVTAHLMQKYVEAPSHELGKKLTLQRSRI